jgi:hypothetical protein
VRANSATGTVKTVESHTLWELRRQLVTKTRLVTQVDIPEKDVPIEAHRLYTPDLDALIFGLSMAPAAEGRNIPDAKADERRKGFRVL